VKPELLIATRYLFAKKSHNVINIISAISSVGMAIGTAALILILSVYNGFDGIICNNMSDLAPDVLLTVSEGKTFDHSVLELDSPDIARQTCILEDNVFFTYSGRQGVARIKGVEEGYENCSGIEKHIVEGEFRLHFGDIPMACVGSALAYKNAIHPRFLDKIEIFYPKRDRPLSPSNPAASLNSVKVRPSGLFSINSETDGELIIVPLGMARELTSYEKEVSGVELRLKDGVNVRKFIRNLSLPEGVCALDRMQQHPALYKMMRYEKMAIFFILIFVVIIIAFNIFGSLSMLIIEKEKDIATLKAMGASDRMTGRIFVLEGWMISLLGLSAGLLAGVGLALLQQHFGIVKMPGNYMIASYPVILKASDVLLTAAGVAAIGLVISVAAKKGSVS